MGALAFANPIDGLEALLEGLLETRRAYPTFSADKGPAHTIAIAITIRGSKARGWPRDLKTDFLDS